VRRDVLLAAGVFMTGLGIYLWWKNRPLQPPTPPGPPPSPPSPIQPTPPGPVTPPPEQIGLLPLPELRRGSTGGYVYGLQARLRAHGISLAVDGIFGPETENAVMSFRYSKGLGRIGVVDGPTWRALLSGPSLPTLRYGSTGPYVYFLQARLKDYGFDPGPVDGVFGPRTRDAVMSFQRAARITADGIVGPVTWGVLLKGYLS